MAQVAQIGASHTLRVTRLYRASLKNLMNWTVWRELWIEKGFELRAKFDANKHITDPRKIEKLLSAGEAELKALAHPDPYTLPHMPGGSKYQRHPFNSQGFPPEILRIPSFIK